MFIRKLGFMLIVPLSALWGQSWCDLAPMMEGSFEAGVDFLYWTHSDCNFNYADLATNVLICPPPPLLAVSAPTEEKFVAPTYDPGFRVRVDYNLDCNSVSLRYLWLKVDSMERTVNNTAPNSLEPNDLFSDFFVGGTSLAIAGKVESQYQAVTADFKGAIARGNWGVAYLTFFMRWASVDHRRTATAESLTFPDSPLRVTQKNAMNGAGMGGSLGFVFHLCEGLTMNGAFSTGGIVADQHVSRKGRASSAALAPQPDPFVYDLDFFVRNRVCYVPFTGMSISLGYVRPCGCYDLSVELAYEMHSYVNGLSWRVGQTGLSADLEDPLFGTISYGGPSIHFAIGF